MPRLLSPPGPEFSAWIDGPNTILAASLVADYCQSLEFDQADLECPCSNMLARRRYVFDGVPLEVGETTAALATALAFCADICNAQGSESNPDQEIAVEVIAVSESCIIAETTSLNTNERIYVDRLACP